MISWRIVLGLVFYTTLSVFHILSIMDDLVAFYYTKGKRKEMKKKESIKDKILFSKYKEKIPTLFYLYYYAVVIVNFILIILYFIFMAFPKTVSYEKWILLAHFVFNSIWNVIPFVMFWQKNLRVNGYKYDRWLKK